YTDLGLIIMGQVIERILGAAIQPIITERVLQPLGLAHTSFQPRLAQTVPTTYSMKTGLLRGIVHYPKARVLGEHCGSAGLFASVTDLVRFS
ncbi:serine hydrolase, partial [Stenotrophomonas maltophilia]